MIEDKGSETTDAGSLPVTRTHTDAKLKIYQFLPHASLGVGWRGPTEQIEREKCIFTQGSTHVCVKQKAVRKEQEFLAPLRYGEGIFTKIIACRTTYA